MHVDAVVGAVVRKTATVFLTLLFAAGAAEGNSAEDEEVLLRDDSGAWYAFFADDGEYSGFLPVALFANTEWEHQATADFDGDRDDDVLLRHRSSGAWRMFEVEASSIVGNVNPGLPANPAMVLQGVADFDDDGDADILLRNASNGAWRVYEISQRAASANYNPGLFRNTVWDFTGIGDADADGDADVLVRQSVTGAWRLFRFVDGVAAENLNPGVFSNPLWVYATLADTDADGDADVLVRQSATGAWRSFTVEDGVAVAVGPGGLPASQLFEFTAALDVDGDVDQDILLRAPSNHVWRVAEMDLGVSVGPLRNPGLPADSALSFVSSGSFDLEADGNGWNVGRWQDVHRSGLRWSDTAATTDLAPVARVRSSYDVEESLVLLSAAESSDEAGAPLSFEWRQIGGPLVDLQNPTGSSASFSAPMLAQQTEYRFRVSVTDENGATSTQVISVVVPAASQIIAVPTEVQIALGTELSANTSLDGFAVRAFSDSSSGSTASLAPVADKPQLVFLDNAAGESVIPALVSGPEVGSGNAVISAEDVAAALLLLQPGAMSANAETREAILSIAPTMNWYAALLDSVVAALGRMPANLMSEATMQASSAAVAAQADEILNTTGIAEFEAAYATFVSTPSGSSLIQAHPEFSAYVIALALVNSALDAGSGLPVEGELVDGRAGPEYGPNIVQFPYQAANGTYEVVNRTYVLYQLVVDDSPRELIGSRDSVLGEPWRSSRPTPGDGYHRFEFANGTNLSGSSELVNTPGVGLAQSANFLKLACAVLDFVFWCPLLSDDIRTLGRVDSDFTEWFRRVMEQDSVAGVANVVMEAYATFPDKLTGALIAMGARARPNVGYVASTRQFLGNLSRFVLRPFGILSRSGPFVIDLLAAEREVVIELCEFEHEFDEITSATECNTPPDAMITVDPAPTISREYFYIAPQEVFYDASGSSDVEDAFEDLEFAWTFVLEPEDGSDDIVTGSTFEENFPDFTVRHSTPGRLTVTLEVMDSEGEIGVDEFRAIIVDEVLPEYPEYIDFTVDETGRRFVVPILNGRYELPGDSDPGILDFDGTSEFAEIVGGLETFPSIQVNVHGFDGSATYALDGIEPVLEELDPNFEQSYAYLLVPRDDTFLTLAETPRFLLANPGAAPGQVDVNLEYEVLGQVTVDEFLAGDTASAREIARGTFDFAAGSVPIPFDEVITVSGDFRFSNGDCHCVFADPEPFVDSGPTITSCPQTGRVDLGLCPVIPSSD